MRESGKRFEIVTNREIEGTPEFEIHIFGEELDSDLSDSEKDRIFFAFRRVALGRDLLSPDSRNLIDYLLPGEVMRSEGMQEGIPRSERLAYKMSVLSRISASGEESNIVLERLLRKRTEFARSHFEATRDRLEKNREFVEEVIVDVLGNRFAGGDPAFITLLEKRIATVGGLEVIDPLFNPDLDFNGIFTEYDGVRTICINGFAPNPELVYTHELLHALQTDFTLIERDDEFGDLYGDNSGVHSVRTGINIDRGNDDEMLKKGIARNAFRALNEAITENLTRYIAPDLRDKISELDLSEDLNYLHERDQLGNLIDFVEDRVGPSEAGVLRDQFYLAAFADDVNSEQGRAYHLRQLSRALRSYFGDGALVAIDNEMERQVGRFKTGEIQASDEAPGAAFRDFLESRFNVKS